VAATLPLLAAFLDYPVCEPSPYSPASRLFWNEFYLDVPRVPEFSQCREAQALVRSKSFQTQLRAFRRSDVIDYRAQWAARRSVLELLAKSFFSKTSPRRVEFNRFLREHPEVKEYSAFCAVCDKLKTSWHHWPQRLREGSIRNSDFDEATQRFHLYVQWLAHQQVDELIQRGEQNGVSLYLDLPLGVNPDGYDVWRERESFAMGASAGAPPDLFFSKGQDWGFAPLHPRRIRESGYRYVLAFLRFQMRHARLLRIDHVMGLHRLYWVPRGFDARQGTYVNYPAEELHAIFNLESRRNRTRLVGENLGTVPPIVNESMEGHGLRSMFVVQFEERPDARAALGSPPALSVASLNTHDTPTFAAHWRGDDLVDSVRLGLLPRQDLKNAKQYRERLKKALIRFLKAQGFVESARPDTQEIVRALLSWMKASPAEIVLINLEDLWLETRPQNVPGTSSERPNWRRKAWLSLEQIFRDKRLRIPF
jgi:4-alpha-glucanotransferase